MKSSSIGRKYSVEVCIDGGKYWFLDGLQHREDGPAAEWGEFDACQWWLNGNILSKSAFDGLISSGSARHCKMPAKK